MNKIRVGAVSYLNTKPLLYGIKNHPIINEIELIEDYPSKIAQALIDNKIDLGLIPVAATIKLPVWNIVSDYCIGCDGPVASVCLFSDVPISDVQTVMLDYQSRTSVNLARILLKEYWRQDVHLLDVTGEDFRSKIRGSTAGVVIGDRALEQRKQNRFMYDLGEEWKRFTGLPFVFAAWISNKKLSADFERQFNEANALGLQHINDLIDENPYETYDLKHYFTRNISYKLTPGMRQGMELFLQKLHRIASQPYPTLRQ